MAPQLVLGSTSFIRPRLLNAVGMHHIVAESPADENQVQLRDFADPRQFAVQKAFVKAMGLADAYPDDVIIGSDSIIVQNGKVFEKPADEHQLRAFATAFSESSHEVVSAVCVLYKGQVRTSVESMTVYFDRISGDALDRYVQTQTWRKIAGGFGIQSPAAQFVRRVDGDFYAGAGIPIRALHLLLREFGVQ